MKKYFSLLVLSVCVLFAHAEVLVLRTGTQVRGTIVFQNEEVIVFKDASGARYQYPRAEVLSISDDADRPAATQQSDVVQDLGTASSKKVSVLFELSGGATFIPNDTIGGNFEADLLVGSHNMLGKRIFLGGGVGYLGEYVGVQRYAFLPIQLAARIPLLQQEHAPMVGLALGYGVGLSKNYSGGLYAGINVGYCYQINAKSALFVAADVRFLQARIDVKETFEDTRFNNHTGRSFVHTGVRLGFFF